MTSSADLAKAVSACHKISKQFSSFPIVAKALGELGDVKKEYDLVLSQREALGKQFDQLLKRKVTAEEETVSAEQERDAAVKSCDGYLEGQKAVAEDILSRARDEASQIDAKTRNEADAVREMSLISLAKADEELSQVKVRVAETISKLNDLRSELAIIKGRL